MAAIRVGIVGTGGMANWHAERYKTIKGAIITSCFDVMPAKAEAYAAKHGIANVARSMEEILDTVDAVDIVTPDRFHFEGASAAIRAGRHVLCEKPLTTDYADARKLARAAKGAQEKTGLIHMINFSYRDSAAFQAALAVVARGELGEIRHVNSHYLQSWLASDHWGNWTGDNFLWRLQTSKGSGGALGDIGCHILDFTTAIAGELNTVRCTLQTFPKIDAKGKAHTSWKGIPFDANDSAVIELRFANGALGVCHTSRWATGHTNSVFLEVHGTEGALCIDLDKGWERLSLCTGKDRQTAKWKEKIVKKTPNNYQRFIRAIQTGIPDQPDIPRGARVQAYLEACFRSANNGRAEKIPN